MSGGLFGSASAAATNTVGDLGKDVAIANPPEDSISDLTFNPNPADTKDILAVSSWDKKVRIYEILGNGTAEGRHLYEHEAPVFSCDFFKVSLYLEFLPPLLADEALMSRNHRMARKSSQQVRTSRPKSATSVQAKQCRWRRTTNPSGRYGTSRVMERQW